SDFTLARNTVDMLGSGNGAAVYVSGRVGLLTMYGNTLRDGYYGAHFSPSINYTLGDTTRVVADSNAISGAVQYGLYLNISTNYTGSVAGAHNNIAGNRYGIYTGFDGPLSFTQGRFVGNTDWAVYSVYPFDATQNWWGDPGGAGGGVADSATAAVDTSSPLTSDPTNVPPLAPPVGAGLVSGDEYVRRGNRDQ
ncbi:MAG: hypothetical protein PVH40_07385, partial [Gemmatimonadales bacterium]